MAKAIGEFLVNVVKLVEKRKPYHLYDIIVQIEVSFSDLTRSTRGLRYAN